MKACLTNTLQPDWFRAGLEGLWAPHLNLRHAHCEYSCNLCGLVCPTGAIRALDLVEKQHAKIGTAVIRRHTCLAWAEDRRCQICDEVCPYNAIFVHREPNRKVGLPVVDTTRCVGCGTCEEKCPVGGEADIVIFPHGEFRFDQRSYVAEARLRGFNFTAKGNLPDQMFVGPGAAPDQPVGTDSGLPQLPPGIEPGSQDLPQLPPGIDADDAGLPKLPEGISEDP
jgi:formate hydrogenlyase subunit 6/NADH:ubiquinone oxidoreductase subunit I